MQAFTSILKHFLLSITISAGGLLFFYWMDMNQKNNLNHLFFSMVLFFGIFLLSISVLILFVLYLAKRYYKQFVSIFVFISLIIWESTMIVGIGVNNLFQTEVPLIGILAIILMAIVFILHASRTKLNSKAG